jgi:hypothetical protein
MTTGVRSGTALFDCYAVEMDQMMESLLSSQEKIKATMRTDQEVMKATINYIRYE